MGGRRILSDQQLDEACAMRERGLSTRQIARHFTVRGTRISVGAVAWNCLVAGADIPPSRRRSKSPTEPGRLIRRGEHVYRTYTPQEDARLIALHLEGKNMSAIARDLGRKPNSVYARMATLARREAREAD